MPTISKKAAKSTVAPKKVAAKKAATPKTVAKRLTYTFADGTKVSGTITQLQKFASATGQRLDLTGTSLAGYYNSTSKGLVKLSDMNDYHLRRALLKRNRDLLQGIYSASDTNAQFMKKYKSISTDPVVSQLSAELAKR